MVQADGWWSNQSFFDGRLFSQNWHFEIEKRITKHNLFVLQSTYVYCISNEDYTFEKKNVSYLLVTSTLIPIIGLGRRLA